MHFFTGNLKFSQHFLEFGLLALDNNIIRSPLCMENARFATHPLEQTRPAFAYYSEFLQSWQVEAECTHYIRLQRHFII